MKNIWNALSAALLVGAMGMVPPTPGHSRPLGQGQPAPVVIGVEDDCAPFAWAERGSAVPQGYAVEVVRMVFREMGVPLELEAMPFGRCMREVSSGKKVACFNSMFNEETDKAFLLHTQPLFSEPLGVLALASGPHQSVDVQGLQGHTVGYVASYQYPDWFMNSTTITRVPASNDKALLLMLARGRVDFVLYGPTMAAWYLKTDPALSRTRLRMVGQVSNDGFGVAFSRQHPQGESLRRRFDQTHQALRARGSFQALQREYLPSLQP